MFVREVGDVLAKLIFRKDGRCVRCKGSGLVPISLNPGGIGKYVTFTKVECSVCAGTGRTNND